MQGRARLLSYLGFIAVAAGFAAIGIGWNGAASKDFVQGQLPYLISGGATGLALVFLGGTLLTIDGARRDRARLEHALSELTVVVERLSSVPVTGEVAARSQPEGDIEATVAIGPHSFHLLDCRLTNGKTGLSRVARSRAVEMGLDPCRICKP